MRGQWRVVAWPAGAASFCRVDCVLRRRQAGGLLWDRADYIQGAEEGREKGAVISRSQQEGASECWISQAQPRKGQ